VVVAHPGMRLPAGNEAVPAVVRPASDGTGWELATPRGDRHVSITPVLKLASLIMIRDAARAGVGAALLPYSLVAGDLQAGTLAAWGDFKGPPIEIWALYPSRRLLSTRVSAFLDCLKEAFPLGQPEELANFAERAG